MDGQTDSVKDAAYMPCLYSAPRAPGMKQALLLGLIQQGSSDILNY